MAKNRIQFQKGLSFAEFHRQYGTEEQCRQALFQWRWPSGFRCPSCEGDRFCVLSNGRYQCNSCRHQASLTSGTLFAGTKLPLTVWFLAIYLLTQSKNAMSALELKRQLGVCYNTAWLLKHKVLQVMKERDDALPLSGPVQIDDAYWGGERRGGKRGRGAPGKTPFLAAVQCTEEGRPLRLRLTRVRGFSRHEIDSWARKHLSPDCTVVSDGLPAFRGMARAGYAHQPQVTGGGPYSVKNPAFLWVNTMLGNVKNAIHGTYHAVREKHLPRYLAEFCYRFNRRFRLEDLLPRFVYVALRTPPLPYRLAKMAEDHG
ncbi:MAG: Transposase [Leptospirillum sp. Group II 'C75']|jgi:transposase-like protein|uniref:Transposase n=1 Tax=Leptospirillum sp. Group II '5-way CG' TaxID=419541 RepID=B6ARX3_9BACT|nr:IS1595-like element ISLsp1 family transposase [Leptospirillum sp. Group II 'CF-1']AKS23120.1 transposase [Leptospirillum sp. Group II 'CF-1']EAY56983.1 MAG: probable transposase [Leptospirillum rubarum]EDZ38219.1 MAG: transposase [Leptospirillum sp. Group II '5-way CG']EIJ75601.1 MAG: Transposase [Leptospirillum sp. Group II 'C75']